MYIAAEVTIIVFRPFELPQNNSFAFNEYFLMRFILFNIPLYIEFRIYDFAVFG